MNPPFSMSISMPRTLISPSRVRMVSSATLTAIRMEDAAKGTAAFSELVSSVGTAARTARNSAANRFSRLTMFCRYWRMFFPR